MDLKAVYDSLDDVPELYKDLFTERDGKAVLNVQGVKTQHDFDKINEGILKEREAHKKTKERFRAFADLDPDDVQEKLSKFDELQEIAASKMDPERISELANERVNKVKGTYEKQLAEAQAMLSDFQQRERRRTIHDAARQALVAEKVLPSAHEDALLLAERVFEVSDDGKVLTRDGVGIMPGLEPQAWLKELADKRPHWWGENSMLNANGSGRDGGGSFGANPWKKDSFSLTEQMRIAKENPALAEQMKKLAAKG
jgi:hypothetical protein